MYFVVYNYLLHIINKCIESRNHEVRQDQKGGWEGAYQTREGGVTEGEGPLLTHLMNSAGSAGSDRLSLMIASFFRIRHDTMSHTAYSFCGGGGCRYSFIYSQAYVPNTGSVYWCR